MGVSSFPFPLVLHFCHVSRIDSYITATQRLFENNYNLSAILLPKVDLVIEIAKCGGRLTLLNNANTFGTFNWTYSKSNMA